MISVIVPVFNVEDYISECIESILAQTFTDIEVLLINDGSTDGSGEICEKYALLDSRIIVTHKVNEGPSPTRNLGIKLSKGKFIGFVDSDDTIDKEMYEKLLKNALINKSDIVTCGYTEENFFSFEKKSHINPLNSFELLVGNEILSELKKALTERKCLGYASMCTKLYRKDFIIKKGIIANESIKIAEDQYFNICAFLAAKRVSSVNESLYLYRRINSSSLMNNNFENFYSHLIARSEIIKVLRSYNLIHREFIKYENSKTVATYLFKIIGLMKSCKISTINEKISDIYNLLKEEYFIEAIKDYDENEFKVKAKLMLATIKVYLKFNYYQKKFD